jgi:hypothetical protein
LKNDAEALRRIPVPIADGFEFFPCPGRLRHKIFSVIKHPHVGSDGNPVEMALIDAGFNILRK